MKILMVTTSYPRNNSDPSGIFIKRLACALVRRGTKITILAPGDPSAKRREWKNGMEIVRFYYAPRPFMKIAYGDGGVPENLRRWPWLMLILPFFFISLIINTIIYSRGCDVIHVNWLPTAFFALPAKIIRKKALVLTIRGSDFKRGVTRLGYFILRKADAITTVNQSWAKDIRNLIGPKVFYTPDGVEISEEIIDPRKRFGISSDKIIVLYVGALRLIKGADILAKIADLTMKMNSSVQFLVVGPGDPKKFGLYGRPNVICAGSLSPREVLAIFPQCDIFVFPTRHEGRGIVFLEAMASGLPCVTTALPVITEILTEETGIVVQVEDVKTFAEEICLLSADPIKRKIMGEKAKHRIKELSLDWDTSATNYLSIFEKLLGSGYSG